MPAIFLDKDGTLIHDVPYNVNPDRIVLRDRTLEGLTVLHQQGYKLIVITNQSGVARGYFTEAAIAPVEAKLRQLLAPLPLAGFYYCPHHPQGAVAEYAIACDCRKPKPGMLQRAAQAQGVDLPQSWFIGDILNDVEAGNRAGCRTVLIDNGNETEWDLSIPERQYTYAVKDIAEAADLILKADVLPTPAHAS
ncbi:MAG: D-glycero-alpha-D-manno-heptose-1,7-bisphosphate 7-phosphatase [Elainellaceae cyanobacterium]